jgi:hypothetical protein
MVQAAYPAVYDTWFYFASSAAYRGPEGILTKMQQQLPADHPLRNHKTSPFVWLELDHPIDGKTYKPADRDCHILPIGGRDRFCEWIRENLPANATNDPILKRAVEPSITDALVDETPGTVQPKRA